MPDVFSSLPELFATNPPDDDHPRVYCATFAGTEHFVRSTSPAQAALSAIEHSQGSVVLMKDRDLLKATTKVLSDQFKEQHKDLFTELETIKPPDTLTDKGPSDAMHSLLVDLAEADTPEKRAKVRERAMSARSREAITLPEATEIQELIAKANEKGGAA